MSAGGGRRQLLAGAAAVAVVVLVALWLVRPAFHGLVMLVYARPSLVEALVVGAVGVAAVRSLLAPDAGALSRALRALQNDEGQAAGRELRAASGRRLLLAVLVGAVTLALVLAIPVLGGAYAQEHVARTLPVESTDSLPGINADYPRILPQSVATQYAENSLQYPRYRLAVGDIAVRNGTPYWSFGLAPDGAVNTLALTGKGASFVDMTTQQKRVDVVEEEMTVGFGVGLGSGGNVVSEYRWRLQKGEYLLRYEDPVMVEHDGDVYMAVPYVTYEHHVRLTPVPVVYTTPRWGGVALVSPDGGVEHLSPAAARDHPVLRGQRLVPFDLTRYYVESMRYSRGILNKWFVHEDELEVAPVPGEGNEQPFLVVTEDRGLQYFVAAEPYGQAQGIYQLWMFDARTGAASRYRLPVESALMGPRKAANFVRKANAKTDWDRFTPSEPVPAVVGDRLYWQIRVVPTDSSGIAYTAFVAADSGDVYSFQTDAKIRAFLAGTIDGDQTDERPGGGDVAVVVVIRDESGQVVNRVNVTRGQTVEIRTAGNATRNRTTTAAG
ncbi:MAG: ABC transporter permease [Halobacteriaceae archaeon]